MSRREAYNLGAKHGLIIANNFVMDYLKGLPKTTDRATFDLLLDLSNEITGSMDKYKEEVTSDLERNAQHG